MKDKEPKVSTSNLTKFAGWYWFEGWNDMIPMYQFWCSIHKIMVINHLPGYLFEELKCPICQRDEKILKEKCFEDG